MLKRFLATAIVAAMILGLVSMVSAGPAFPDTAGLEEEPVLAKLKTLGLFIGDDQGNYNPDATITRAEFCAVVVRARGRENAALMIKTPTKYPDVTAKHEWAWGYIHVADSLGIVKGYPDNTFKPDQPVTQAEALTMLLRAIGYTDSLIGDWPTNYIIKGAELEVIGDDFVSSAGASRKFVGKLIDGVCSKPIVKENEDLVEGFEPTGEGSLYSAVFGLTETVDGVVSKVTTNKREIVIDGKTEKYASGVVVYDAAGKYESVSDLVGQSVKAIKKGTNIVHIQVVTAAEVAGEIDAVDIVNFTVTVDGVKYDVADELVAFRDGEELEITRAAILATVDGLWAVMYLNDDDEVYRIEASKLDNTGIITGKKTTIGADNKVKQQVEIGAGNWYEVDSNTVIVRNGQTANFGDLKIKDDVMFSVKKGKLVTLDAFSKVIEGAKVVSKNEGATDTVTVTKDGVSSTYAVDVSDAEWIACNVGNYYNLSFNRDGEVVAFEDVTGTGEVGVVAAKIKSETEDRVTYTIELTTGESIVLPLDAHGFDMCKNGNDVEDEDGDGDVDEDDMWGAIKKGDAVVVIWGDADVEELYVYSQPLEIDDEQASVAGDVITIDDYTIAVNEETDLVFNGKSKGKTDFLAAVNNATVSLIVEFNLEVDDNGDHTPGIAAKIVASYFTAGHWAGAPVCGIETGDKYVFVLAGTDDYVTANNKTIVVKDGEVAELSDIGIGDRIKSDIEGDDVATYIEVTSDTKKPKLATDGVVAEINGDDKVTITITFTDEVKEIEVTVDGAKVEAETDDCVEWVVEISPPDEGDPLYEEDDEPVIGIFAEDYAGNVDVFTKIVKIVSLIRKL